MLENMATLGPLKRFGVYSALLLCLVQWGLSYPMLDVVLNEKHVPPTLMATIRFVSLIPFVVAFLLYNYRIKTILCVLKEHKWAILLFGLTNTALANIFQNIGMMYTSPALTSIIQSMGPIFVVIMAFFFLKERINAFKVVGIVVAICGSVLLITGWRFDIAYGSFLGNMLILGTAISYAVSSIVVKKVIDRVEPYLFVGLGLIIGALMLLGTSVVMHLLSYESFGAALHIDLEGWVLILFLAIGPGCISLLVWYYLLNFMEVSHQTVWGYLIPIFGIFFSWLMVGDVLSATQFLATVIIISGVAISQIVWKRSNSRGECAKGVGKGAEDATKGHGKRKEERAG
jgi:drug/metabolite transporter (DMT)-like permease